MGAQKKRKESACLAFELISYGVSLFSFVGGTVIASQSPYLGTHQQVDVFDDVQEQLVATVLDTLASPTDLTSHLCKKNVTMSK